MVTASIKPKLLIYHKLLIAQVNPTQAELLNHMEYLKRSNIDYPPKLPILSRTQALSTHFWQTNRKSLVNVSIINRARLNRDIQMRYPKISDSFAKNAWTKDGTLLEDNERLEFLVRVSMLAVNAAQYLTSTVTGRFCTFDHDLDPSDEKLPFKRIRNDGILHAPP